MSSSGEGRAIELRAAGHPIVGASVLEAIAIAVALTVGGSGLSACGGDEDAPSEAEGEPAGEGEGAPGGEGAEPPDPLEGGLAFPPDFVWGVATAGFQVDMGCPTLGEPCNDRHSDWYHFVTSPITRASGNTFLSNESPVEVGPGFWELYAQDLELARDVMALPAFRLSLEWSRLFPTATDGVEGYEALSALANQEAVAHYHAIFAAMRARGIAPLVTLHHYTLPSWIHDAVGCHQNIDTCTERGWLDEERIGREMAKYAGFAAREFGGEVDLWATQNEPLAVVLPGYLQQTWDRTNPPAVALRAALARDVIRSMIFAHARAVDAVREHDQQDASGDGINARVGLVYNMTPVLPRDPTRPLDVIAADNVFYLYNLLFLNAVVGGVFDDNGDGEGVFLPELAGRMDYLGVNYYTRVRVEGTEQPVLPDLSPLTTFNPLTVEVWEDYPDGIYEVVKEAHDRWDVPVLIAENGTIFDGDEEAQAAFLVRHLAALHRALAEGIKLEGYFFWSLIDNFEWNHGSGMRFGLFGVDYQDPARARTVRQAAHVYGQIIRAGGISAALLDRFAPHRAARSGAAGR